MAEQNPWVQRLDAGTTLGVALGRAQAPRQNARLKPAVKPAPLNRHSREACHPRKRGSWNPACESPLPVQNGGNEAGMCMKKKDRLSRGRWRQGHDVGATLVVARFRGRSILSGGHKACPYVNRHCAQQKIT
jgi:hypothetical protein